MKANELAQYLNKFLKSPAAQQARVQIELPNGDKLDLIEIQLLETRIIGDRDTHILNLKGIKRGGTWKMPKIIGKL
jgi:hypothetical protein